MEGLMVYPVRQYKINEMFVPAAERNLVVKDRLKNELDIWIASEGKNKNTLEVKALILDAYSSMTDKLDLSNRGLTSIPACIGELTYLEDLNLNNNKFDTLPNEIGNLRHLKNISLSNNKKLTKLPPEIGNLCNLTHLHASDCNIKLLPPEMGGLLNLTHLYLGGNELSELPEEMCKLLNLVWLDLRDNKFEQIPKAVTSLVGLVELSFKNNQLKTLPFEIANLTNLVGLTLDNNELTLLTYRIEKLVKLRALSVDYNKLTQLIEDPESICKLSNLVKLCVIGNEKLAELPEGLNKIASLEIIAAHGTEVPPVRVREILDACEALRNGHDFYTIYSKASVTEVEVEVTKVEPMQNSILKEWLLMGKV